MRNKIAFCFLFLLLLSGPVAAQESGTGIGIILGEPTGISLKGWVSGKTAVDFAVAWSFVGKDSLHIHADYLVHDFSFFRVREGTLALYYGIGGRIKGQKNARVGVRVPVGLCYIFENIPLDIFLEIGPLLDLTPATEFEMTASIGARYYF